MSLDIEGVDISLGKKNYICGEKVAFGPSGESDCIIEFRIQYLMNALNYS